MSKEEKIKSQLFEIKTDLGTDYVIAYDHSHALSCVSHYLDYDIQSITKLTGKFGNHLTVAKECLPQGLVSKIIKE